jgi:acyl-coenzyme A thioesterase PaaI-like protein
MTLAIFRILRPAAADPHLSVGPQSHKLTGSKIRASCAFPDPTLARSLIEGLLRRSLVIAADPVATRQQMDWLSMTHTNAAGPTLLSWQKLSGSRFGRWLFARRMQRRAPYIGSIRPRFVELRPALCIVSFQKRRRVQGSEGSVHALAIGNLCELAANMVTEVSVPPALKWITRGMTIEYLRKAHTAVTATARLDKSEWSDAQSVGVPVSVVDANGAEVVRAVISLHVGAQLR